MKNGEDTFSSSAAAGETRHIPLKVLGSVLPKALAGLTGHRPLPPRGLGRNHDLRACFRIGSGIMALDGVIWLSTRPKAETASNGHFNHGCALAGTENDTGTNQRMARQIDGRTHASRALAHARRRSGGGLPNRPQATHRVSERRHGGVSSCCVTRSRQVQYLLSRHAAWPALHRPPPLAAQLSVAA